MSRQGLHADCLLHLGKLREAAWAESEDAPDGSLETMESLVCSIKHEPMPFAWRAELLGRVRDTKNAVAAMDLIALDAAFPIDLWNERPNAKFLNHDLVVARAAGGNLRPSDPQIHARARHPSRHRGVHRIHRPHRPRHRGSTPSHRLSPRPLWQALMKP